MINPEHLAAPDQLLVHSQPRRTVLHAVVQLLVFSAGVLVFTILPMMAAAGIVAGLMSFFSLQYWKPYHWIILSPLLYLGWLMAFLPISALTCAILGKNHPKPRFKAVEPGQPPSQETRGLYAAAFCYRRLALLNSLPLITLLREVGPFRDLVLRAYSSSAHVGEQSLLGGELFDPDLTEIGDSVLIGAHATISAHSTSIRPDGGFSYLTAPIKIGNRSTIGGRSLISPGCTIEDDVIIEIGSVLPVFTRVPRGEVWGGNPARFVRKREELQAALPLVTDAQPKHTPASNLVSDDIRALVIEALELKPEDLPDTLDSAHCEFWDSMGQMAIATMISDRYGVSVPAKQVPRIHNLQDVADLVSGYALEISQ